MENKFKVREDLNSIVKEIKFGLKHNRFSDRKVCTVTVFNGDVIEFSDTEGIYDMILTYRKLGLECVKTAKLVEEIQKNPTDEDKDPLFVCVLVTLNDGKEFRLFPSRRADRVRIDAYYMAKTQEKTTKKAE